MTLISIDRWLEKYFPEGERPSEQTIRRGLRTGKIPGKKVVGTWYVNESAWLASNSARVARILAA